MSDESDIYLALFENSGRIIPRLQGDITSRNIADGLEIVYRSSIASGNNADFSRAVDPIFAGVRAGALSASVFQDAILIASEIPGFPTQDFIGGLGQENIRQLFPVQDDLSGVNTPSPTDISAVATIDNPNRIGLEIEVPSIIFTNITRETDANSDTRVLGSSAETTIDQIPLFQVTYDFGSPTAPVPILEIKGGVLTPQDYSDGDFFLARNTLVASFDFFKSTPNTLLSDALQRYNDEIDRLDIDGRYKIDISAEAEAIRFSIPTVDTIAGEDEPARYSAHVNVGVAYDSIGDPTSGFRSLLPGEISSGFPDVALSAETLARTITPTGSVPSAELKSFLAHLFLIETQHVLRPSGNFNDETGIDAILRVSGEDVVGGILSDSDVLNLKRWIDATGVENARTSFYDAIRDGAEEADLYSDAQIARIGTDSGANNRFDSIFNNAINSRIENGRGQLPDTVEHLGIYDADSRQPILENGGRYYTVLENRDEVGSDVQQIVSGALAWDLSNPDNLFATHINTVQNADQPAATPSISRGQLLIEVAIDGFSEASNLETPPLNDGLVSAIRTEIERGGLTRADFIAGIETHHSSLDAGTQGGFAAAVTATLTSTPDLVVGVDTPFIDGLNLPPTPGRAILNAITRDLPSYSDLPSEPDVAGTKHPYRAGGHDCRPAGAW